MQEIFARDLGFPRLDGKNQTEINREIADWLSKLLKRLRFSFNNLGEDNFNETSLKELTNGITDPVIRGLSKTGEIDVNGENVKGSLEGVKLRRSVFVMELEQEDDEGGEIVILRGGGTAGGIRLDDEGAGTAGEGKYRLLLTTASEDTPIDIVLRSGGNLRHYARKGVYLNGRLTVNLTSEEIMNLVGAHGVRIKATDGAVDLGGNVTVNEKTLPELVTDIAENAETLDFKGKIFLEGVGIDEYIRKTIEGSEALDFSGELSMGGMPLEEKIREYIEMSERLDIGGELLIKGVPLNDYIKNIVNGGGE